MRAVGTCLPEFATAVAGAERGLGREDEVVHAFVLSALRTIGDEHTAQQLTRLVLACGKTAASAMALLDAAWRRCWWKGSA